MGQAGWYSLPDPTTPVFFVFLLFSKFDQKIYIYI
jgi:hypothetical protein